MVTIYQAQDKEDLEYTRELFFEFLTWAIGKSKKLYNEYIDIDKMLNHSMSEIDKGVFSPPHGRLMLAKEADQAAGIACMKKIREGTCEIKRIYVRPGYRGKKIGQKLLDQLIQSAREVEYSKILLDSARFMKEAHSLYRSAGFKEIEIYSETEMTGDFQEHMVYMELKL
ncbi:MAG: GNAT family N-acetyltransferase [Desulfobacterales bacterium]|nr:GNAT family N-acetyltransferase [Desulfobacterales bacterium]MBU8909882.1 GNAT family N-acetyltransferase [Desulfobacterales bacterium]